jgi:hypothetical protein
MPKHVYMLGLCGGTGMGCWGSGVFSSKNEDITGALNKMHIDTHDLFAV